MTGSFCLRKLENALQIADAHFTVAHNKIQDAKTGGVRTGEKNLRPEVNIEMF